MKNIINSEIWSGELKNYGGMCIVAVSHMELTLTHIGRAAE